MFIIDRDIYMILLGGALSFLANLGKATADYLLAFRLDKIKRDRDAVYQEGRNLRAELLKGVDDPQWRGALHGR
jgi:hypothetical protein